MFNDINLFVLINLVVLPNHISQFLEEHRAAILSEEIEKVRFLFASVQLTALVKQ
jgi:hypothetical protein